MIKIGRKVSEKKGISRNNLVRLNPKFWVANLDDKTSQRLNHV